jgi:hypothetical protein
MLVEVPEQMVVLLAETETVGVGLTVTITVCVDVQPETFVPVTVYVVVDVGETETVVPLNEPGIQEYVVAPEPVRFVLPPEQIVGLLAVAVTVGFEFTVIVRVAVDVHPLAAVPVTV